MLFTQRLEIAQLEVYNNYLSYFIWALLLSLKDQFQFCESVELVDLFKVFDSAFEKNILFLLFITDPQSGLFLCTWHPAENKSCFVIYKYV